MITYIILAVWAQHYDFNGKSGDTSKALVLTQKDGVTIRSDIKKITVDAACNMDVGAKFLYTDLWYDGFGRLANGTKKHD